MIREVAPGAGQHESRAVAQWFGPGAIHNKLQAQFTAAFGSLFHNEILSHAVHAHGVFFSQTRATKTHRLPLYRNPAMSRKCPRVQRRRPSCALPLHLRALRSSCLDRHYAKAFAGKNIRRRTEPEPFTRDLTLKPLERATQLRAIRDGADGQAVALILCARHGPKLLNRNGQGVLGRQ
jgi:hypothetical protein